MVRPVQGAKLESGYGSGCCLRLEYLGNWPARLGAYSLFISNDPLLNPILNPAGKICAEGQQRAKEEEVEKNGNGDCPMANFAARVLKTDVLHDEWVE